MKNEDKKIDLVELRKAQKYARGEFLHFVKMMFKHFFKKMQNEFVEVKNVYMKHIKSFNFKNYWLKYIYIKDDKVTNFFIMISFFFIFKMLYHFFMFFLYTIDVMFILLGKYIFIASYNVFDHWETHMYQKAHEHRKERLYWRVYKKEYAELAFRRAKFCKKLAIDFNNDLKDNLQFSTRNYSVFLKNVYYMRIVNVTVFRWISLEIKWQIEQVKERINVWYKKVIIEYYWNDKILTNSFLFYNSIILLYWRFRLFLKVRREAVESAISNFFLVLKYRYVLKRDAKKKLYNFLYLNFFLFHKLEKKYYIGSVLLNHNNYYYKNEAVILSNFTFFFYLNFKMIYFLHRYIREDPFLVFLEEIYYDFVLVAKDNDFFFIKERDYMRYILKDNGYFYFFKDYSSRFLRFLIRLNNYLIYLKLAYFDPHYPVIRDFVKKYSFIIMINVVPISMYVICFPFIFNVKTFKNFISAILRK